MSVTKKNERLCITCRTFKNKNDLIKITKTKEGLIINPNSKTFGRSAYLCYNAKCVEEAFKKNKLGKALHTAVPSELKGQLINEL